MSKITAYTALTSPASNDVLPVVDVNDTSMASTGTTKKITVANLLAAGVDWLNVTQYGADNTGAADATTAIQDALNAAAQGQPVYLPAGTYKTTSPLTLPPGSVLLGDSAWDDSAFGDIGTTIKPSAAFTGTEILYMTDSGSAKTLGSVIRDIAIDGSALTVTADGIRAFGPVVKVVIENVTISTCTGWGINQLTDSGVASGNTCPYSWRATHVLVSNCATGGFNLPAMTDSTWTDVETIGSGGTSGHGFAITGAPSNSHFTNCRAEWTGTGDGFHLTGAWNTGTAAGGFTMAGCSTDRNTQNGFYCNATGYAPVILSGCMFRRDGRNSKSGGGSYAGIQLSSASIPLIFTNVTVFPGVDDDGTGTNSPQYGVSFASSTYVQILSGYIQGNTAGVNGTVSGSQLIAPNVIVASGSTGGPSTQLTDLYRQSSGIIQTDNDIQVPAGFVSALRYNASGITGATAASRYVGATTSGAPVSGTFITGDYVIDQSGTVWVCTAGGTSGTWAQGGPKADATATDIQPDGAQTAGSNGKWADSGHVHPGMFGGYDMEGSTMIGQTMPLPAACSSLQPASGQAGVLMMFRTLIPVAGTTSTITMYVTNAGNTLANVYLALVNLSGTIVASTANRASDAALTSNTTVWTVPWSSSYAAAAGYYYVSLLIGSATTMPTFLSGTNRTGALTGLGRTAAGLNLMSASYSSGLSALPGSVTMSSMGAYLGLPWIGLT